MTGPDTDLEDDDPIVVFMARQPDLLRRLLAAHVRRLRALPGVHHRWAAG